MATNGQTVYQTGQHSLDGDSIQSYSNVGSEQKKERRRRREEKIWALLQCQCMNAPQLYKDSKPDSMDTITLDTNFNLLVTE